MRSVKSIKTAKIGYIAISAALCIGGILLAAAPAVSASVCGMILGVLLLAFGGIRLVGYFSKDLFRLAFQYDLAFGILLIVLGMVLLVRPEETLGFLCVILGIYILADGLLKIQIAIDSKRFGIRWWWLILASAVLAGVAGLLLVFRPDESVQIMTVILGISLLFDGILNLITVLTAVKIIKHQRLDVIEAEYCEAEGDEKE